MTLERRIFETRGLRLEQRAEGKMPLIRGYAVVFNALSSVLWGFREEIAPEAFADSVESGDVRALWSHQDALVLGRTKNGTLSLAIDDEGVRYDLEPAATQAGRDAVTSIRRGDVDAMSFGFRVLPEGASWRYDDDEQLIRRVTNAELIEISPVAFPAYPQTNASVRALRELYGEEVDIPPEFRGATDLGAVDAAVQQALADARNRRMRMLALS